MQFPGLAPAAPHSPCGGAALAAWLQSTRALQQKLLLSWRTGCPEQDLDMVLGDAGIKLDSWTGSQHQDNGLLGLIAGGTQTNGTRIPGGILESWTQSYFQPGQDHSIEELPSSWPAGKLALRASSPSP